MLSFNEWQQIQESLPIITLNDIQLEWNINKSQQDWIERIIKRTEYSKETFFEIIQNAINKYQNDLCEEGDTCLILARSKFILILNKKESKIVTIRDTEWEKPIGNKPCKRVLTFESDEDKKYYIEKLLKGQMDYSWGEYNISENWELIVESYCSCCVEVNL